jgi:mutator protein MutT
LSTPLTALLHVVAGVLRDASGRVLVAERPVGRHLAGGWEFPGGKLGADEPRRAGLARELREEIGIRVEAARPLMQIRHHYPDRSILLDVWLVTRYEGIPASLDGQRLRWCGDGDLGNAGLLPADQPVVAALRLPERLTAIHSAVHEVHRPWSGGGASGRLQGAWCAGDIEARAAAGAGAEFLAMGCRLPASALAALCGSVNVPVFARGIGLEEAWESGATGVNECG